MTDTGPLFAAPAVVTENHDLSGFASGERSLDEWLQTRALDNLHLGASRTYVVCPAGSRQVVAYYALAMGSIIAQDVPGSMRRNMPRAIPAVILGRLAVATACQGCGLGGMLLRDAVLRASRAASEVSARLVIVHALSPAAEAFYVRHGFVPLPGEGATLALDLMKLARIGWEKA